MNLWRCKLIDSRTARIRLVLSLVRQLPLLVIVWLIFRSSAFIFFLTLAACYLSILEFFVDHWRLRHPAATTADLVKIRLPWVVLLVAIIPIFLLLLR